MNTQLHTSAVKSRGSLYTWAAIPAALIVFAGFARTYYLRPLFGAPALPWLLHVHGALMTAWFALYFIQTSLISAHRVDLHKRLGILGAVLASTMVAVGVVVAVRAAARNVHAPPVAGRHPLQFMGFILFVLLVFASLVSAALLLRRRRDWHKRLMLLSCLSMTGPGLVRIPLNRLPSAIAFLRTGGTGGLFGIDLLLVYACIAYDAWRHRRFHPAFIYGGLLVATIDLPFVRMFLHTPTWTHFATWLVSRWT